MSASKSCFILGLPAAGKTSYLAALAYSLQQRAVETKLHWRNFTDDHQYLTSLAETWLKCEPVSRTSMVLQHQSLPIRLWDDNDNVFDVTFPDLSGEIFQRQYTEREISRELSEHIINCDGVLLFLNPNEIIEPALISELPLASRTAGKNLAPAMEREAGKTDPTEVQLVELLQDIDYLTNNERCTTIPLVIVVSAWDVAEKKYSTPEDCLVARTPFLWQYLKANNDVFAVSYFGVSAQGGAFESEVAVNELYNQFEDCPAERIIVVDNTGKRSHDITLPLWEAMN